MIERNFILFISSVILNIVLTVCLIFTCHNNKMIAGSKDSQAVSAGASLEEPEEQFPEIDKEQLEDSKQDNQQADAPAPARVSYTAARPSSGLAGIRGRVNAGEINPVNLINPDINVLKQMGAEQYLIHYFTGEQFYKAGDYDKAISEYTTAININQNFTEAFISRGNNWLKKGDYARAIDDFSRAIRLDSSKAEVYNYRGFARMERRDHAQALDDFNRAIALSPNYVDALINRSYAYYQTGNYDRVIEDCTRVISLEPGNAFIWNRRGSAYYHKGDDDRAISDFTEAIRLRHDYSIAFQNRGNAWQSKGDTEKANADFAAARQLGAR